MYKKEEEEEGQKEDERSASSWQGASYLARWKDTDRCE